MNDPADSNANKVNILDDATSRPDEVLSNLIADNNVDGVKMVLAKCACPDIMILDDTRTKIPAPLMAAQYNQVILRVFIEAGASLDSTDKAGNTALHHAVRKMRHDNVVLLVENGHAINVENKRSETPLHIALDPPYASVETIEYLLEHGGDPSIRSNHGETPLYLFVAMIGEYPNIEEVTKERIHIVDLLVKAGASVNASDSQGVTILHNAAGYRDMEIVKYLVDAGADINVPSVNEETPLDYVFGTPMEFETGSVPDPSSREVKEVAAFLASNGAVKGKEL